MVYKCKFTASTGSGHPDYPITHLAALGKAL